MKNILVIFLLVGCVFLDESSTQSQTDLGLPSDFPVCKRNAANLNACLVNLMTEWTLMFRDGIEALNIPPTDPLKLGRVNFVYDNGFLKGVISLKKTRIVGISGLQVRNISIAFNGTDFHMEEESFIPSSEVTALYRGDISLAGIKLTPHGFLNVSLYNLTLFTTYNGHTLDRDNGYSYLILDNMKSTSNLDLMRLNVTGISSDSITNDATVDFMNTNWQQIYNTMVDETVSIWEPYVHTKLKEFCALVPLLQN